MIGWRDGLVIVWFIMFFIFFAHRNWRARLHLVADRADVGVPQTGVGGTLRTDRTPERHLKGQPGGDAPRH